MTSLPRRLDNDVDWDQVGVMLGRSVASVQALINPPSERVEQSLDERARLLARPPAEAQDTSDVVDLLTFELSGERYGIETRHVQEVVPVPDVTIIPGLGDEFVGLVSLRGEILAVFDIRPLLGMRIQDATGASRIVVCRDGSSFVGVMADAVAGVVRLASRALLSSVRSRDPSGADFIRGVAPDALIVIDGERLLDDRRLFVDQSGRQ